MSHEQNIEPTTLLAEGHDISDIEKDIENSLNNELSQQVEVHGVSYTIYKDFIVFDDFETLAVWYYRMYHKKDLDILYDINGYESKEDWKASILNECHACENEDGFIIKYD